MGEGMTTGQLLAYFRSKYPFFDRDALYSLTKRGKIRFVSIPRGKTGTKQGRFFSPEEVRKLELLLQKRAERMVRDLAYAEAIRKIQADAGDEDAEPRKFILVVADIEDHREAVAACLEHEVDRRFAVSAKAALDP